LKNPLSPPEIIALFKTFHYDTALCGSDPQFSLTAAFVPEDKLVYGTDHPYAVRDAMLFFSDELGKRDWKGNTRKMMDSSNAGKLFPRFK
jgi:6-methylsalicylate decarboxylase